ncbi:dihydrodipicolinate reductase-like protein CRR1, chloroplastic isoform X1 [Cryptomeria japonica]|uniref:dihydrodipicolinate reductase-like protein CRR1, chloroplastic isoform X1 n=1 Tax=Cryptomeria japonica TaxID=3369 RepID=UPI0027D9F6F1|nr:dihydrodipicolinate reductase-like protein CRR1, chloroplastic isoform X1 [Cryptomeria japonica]XP_057868607.2 dihydrodipicolinate reductase-like protein CRR1, chloroplastic isoform X1 [Cryptomeria japonica]
MAMAMPVVASTYFGLKPTASRPLIECAMPSSRTGTIRVIVNGAGKDIGRAAIAAISKARGMELAGAIDPLLVGMDAGEIANLDEPLEVPVLNDLVMLLTSLSQSRTAGVLVDFSEPYSVYDNVRQATAFGMRSVVHVPGVDMDVIASLSKFCEKASMGCIISPTLSIGSLLLEKAAMTAAYHYDHVEIVESRPDTSVCPSPDTIQLANNLSGLGQTYNKNDLSTDSAARGAVVGDGVRVHSMALPGLCSSMEVHFSAPGEVLSIKHDMTNLQSLMPGLLLAIRRVVRLKSLVYGLEKFL